MGKVEGKEVEEGEGEREEERGEEEKNTRSLRQYGMKLCTADQCGECLPLNF